MNGLEYIKQYQAGGDVTDTDEDIESKAPLAVGKAVTSKSPYALPTATGATAVDEGILQRMQQLIAEREARKGGFSEGMLDAQAWWSGGMAGPYKALAERRAQKEADEATTFGMRRDIAQYRAAQEQARAMDRVLGLTTPTAQAGAPTAQTGMGQPGMAEPTAQAPQRKGLLDLVEDPGLRQSIEAQALSGDRTGAMKSVQNYLAKNATNTDLVKNIKRGVAEGWLTQDMVPGFFATGLAGPSAFKLEDVRGAGGTGQVAPITTASQMVGQRGGMPTGRPSMPAARPAMPGGAAAPVRQPMQGGATPFATPTTPSVAAAPAPRTSVTTTPTAPADEAPLVPTNLVTGFAPGTKEDLQAREAYAKQQIEIGGETQKPIAKQIGESVASIKKSASSASDNIREYDMAESILRKYPKAFGISQDGSATAAVIQLVKPGTTIPILGTIKSENIEEAIAQKRLPPQALAARATFNAIATRQGVEFAKNNLTGEGRGTLSNADLKMAGVAKGLSTDSPAAANLIFTVLNRENEQMILDRNKLIENFEKESRAKGVQPNYNVLRESEAWKKTMSEKDARIRKRFPEFFKDEAPASKSGKPSPSDFLGKK